MPVNGSLASMVTWKSAGAVIWRPVKYSKLLTEYSTAGTAKGAYGLHDD